MKKLLAAGCCFFALQNISHTTLMNEPHDQSNGRRVLLRAIAIMVNSEAASKVPQKRISVPNLESPRG